MATARTPGKWHISLYPDGIYIANAEQQTVYDSRDADVWPMSNADREHLERCVNTHGDLIATCEAVQAVVKRHNQAFGQEASALAFIKDPETAKAFTDMRTAITDARSAVQS